MLHDQDFRAILGNSISLENESINADFAREYASTHAFLRSAVLSFVIDSLIRPDVETVKR